MRAPVEPIELSDIQGLVARAYGRLPHARYLLLAVDDAVAARRYLRDAAGRVTPADVSPDDAALHVAFTHPGLRALGVPDAALATFPRELKEGMDDDVRAASLGDEGANAPSTWTWGARHCRPVHALLLVYARDEALLDARVAAERAAFAGGFDELVAKPTRMLPAQKEHFGWRDGLSHPILEGIGGREQEWWTYPIRPGEFVLGYPNEYDRYEETPRVSAGDDPSGELPDTRDGEARDLGRNGTYLVYREMTQDVPALWRYLASASREPGDDPAARAIALGAKMVGRWPGGAPLVTSPERDCPERARDNAFGFEGVDDDGLRCPLGAHIRRANPRDLLPTGHGPEASVEMVRKHQLLRRGRPFGAPLADSMEARDLFARRDEPDAGTRGLHFLCLVAHVGRQFEFVQRAWLQSANFAAQFRDGDPIVAARRPASGPNPNDDFTVPAEPLRRKYRGLPAFTRVVGGSYFFLPGRRALRFIARDR